MSERLHVVQLAVETNCPISGLVGWVFQHDIECQYKGQVHLDSPEDVPAHVMEVKNVSQKHLAALLLRQSGITVLGFRKLHDSDWSSNER